MHLSFNVRWYLSILPTCSRSEEILMSLGSTSGLTFSNYLSISTLRTTNPPIAFNLTIFINDLANYLAMRDGTCSAVPNLMSRDKVVKMLFH